RDRLRQVVEVLPEAILIVDADGRFIIGNATAVEILGVELVGRQMAMDADDGATYGSQHLDGTLYQSRDLPLQRSLLRGEVVRGEQLLLRNVADRRDIPVLANSAPLRDGAGRIAGAVVVFQDITAIKELERARDEFLSSISHDLKTPLTTIQGLAQLSLRRATRLEGAEGERLAGWLAGIVTATGRVTGLINQLLDTALLQMGRPLTLDRRSADLVALARQVAAEQQGATRRHRIRVDAATPELIGPWDAARLERVVANLLTNAIKYSPDGGPITLTVAREEDGAGPWAVLKVRDRGLGIPAADLPRVFERFYRAGNVPGQVSGTGIGLASVRQIVEQHGGTVAVESAEGAGTAFTIRLPLAE
ncbi:MAG: PAS domain-containing sensor histidine kinase, partial [Chloroflexota bacterium]|nr:PAS domain-containing sensor histidine kinase [Chloroflexota bacterium]